MQYLKLNTTFIAFIKINFYLSYYLSIAFSLFSIFLKFVFAYFLFAFLDEIVLSLTYITRTFSTL